jgi:dephospho-CoA kinase
MKSLLIGITGTDGAGKGTVVAKLVEQWGFVHYSARALLLEKLIEQAHEPTRANMRLIANEMRAAYGNDYLVQHYLARRAVEKPPRCIIESIRAVAEAETLKAHGGILLAVDADQHVRYARVQGRRSETDKVSFEQFVAHESLEANDPNPHGMQKQRVIQMADYVLLNNGSIQDLEREIATLLTSLTEA